MSLLGTIVDVLLGNQSLPPEEKQRRAQEREAKLAGRQQEALARAAKTPIPSRPSDAPRRSSGRPVPTRHPAGDPTRSDVAAGSEVVPYTGAVTVSLPSGRVARYGWQAYRPAALSPLYATLDSELLEKILTETKDTMIEDPNARLLDHISPSHASEDLSYYNLDDRFYTTLPIRKFGGAASFDPNTWPGIVGNGSGETSTLSLHFWRTSIAVAEKGLRDQIGKLELKLEELRTNPADNQTKINDMKRDIGMLQSQLKRVISREETLFRVSAYLRVGADSLPELHRAVKNLQSLAYAHEMVFDAALAKQRDAYVSSMPFSADPADYTHAMVATDASYLFPFLTRKHQEADARGRPVGILYGLHRYNRTPVMISPWNSDDTVQITTVLGQPGSGKSYWLRCHLGRLAMTGVQVIAIDPLGDFDRWFKQNGGQSIPIHPDSPWHINPLKITQEHVVTGSGEAEISKLVDENIDVKINQRLKPLFKLLLGEEYSGMADGLIGHGLRVFYDRYGAEEHLIADLVNILRELNASNEEGLSAASLDERRRLIDNLKLKLVDGEFRTYFAYPTNVELNNRKIVFDLSKSRGGLQQAFACYLAVTMAVNLALQSHDRKIILVDEIHRLFAASESADGISKTLEDLLRTHRHWNAAVTFATQFVRDDKTNSAQEALLQSTTTWILMRATEPMLVRAQKLVGENANLDVILKLLKAPEAARMGQDKRPRPAILFRQDVPIPIYSIGLEFEDKEDDEKSATRVEE